ncbi:hypothetical protein KH5_08430 [Urechidicola sp. KH5]
MKTLQYKLIAFVGIALISLGAHAQLDRTKMPKAGPEPTINLEKPDEFKLKNGISVMVVENNKLPRVSYQLSIDNKPYLEGEKAGVLSILSAMLGNGTTSISKDAFNEEVDFLGANISFSSSGGFGSGLVKYSDRIVELMADATINPLLTEEEFIKEKDKLIENLKSNEKSLDAIASRVGSALSYGKDHVYGEYITEETINNISFQDVLDLYKIRFAPNNATIVVIGDINVKTAKKQLKKFFGSWESSELLEIEDPQLTPNVDITEIDFIDLPNATQSNITVTSNVNLKQNDNDYFAVLMANNILGGGGEGYLFKNLREDKGYTYGAYSRLGANRYGVARFSASAKVRNEVTDSAVVEFLNEIKRIRTELVDPQTLKDAKAKYVGNFVMSLERPQTIANYALNIKRNNLPDDFYATYLENINKVTVEDVNRVAKTYFPDNNARIVIVGKASETLENLEKVGVPINYYDAYANPTEKPEINIPIPDGVTVKTVLEGYINAIGGADKIAAVESVITNYEGTMPMGTIAVVETRVSDKYAQSTLVNGNAMMGVVATQEEMFMKQGGQKIPLPPSFLDDTKATMGTFYELALLKSDSATLVGIEKVNGNDAYVIEWKGNSMSNKVFYDTASGLKVKEVSVIDMGGQQQTSEASYSDYKEVDGILFANKRSASFGPQTVEMSLKEALINSGVSDEDFQ